MIPAPSWSTVVPTTVEASASRSLTGRGGGRPDYCGHRDKGYKLECVNNEYLVLQFEELKFRVLNFNGQSANRSRMTIARMGLWDNLCPEKKLTTALNYTLYDYYSDIHENITLLYGCPPSVPIPFGNRFECSRGDLNIDGYFEDDSLPPYINLSLFNEVCDATMKVPIFKTTAFNEVPVGEAAPLLEEALKEGFEVEYPQSLLVACTGCEHSGGRCGSNSTSQFVCFCRDGVQFLNFSAIPFQLNQPLEKQYQRTAKI